MGILPDLIYSGWAIDVWDCYGVLKRADWPWGRGCVPEVAGVRFVRTPEGWFLIPIPVDAKEPSEAQLSEAEGILWQEIERQGGAINISGFYPVSIDGATRLDDALFPEDEESWNDEGEEELEEVEEDEGSGAGPRALTVRR